MSETLLKDSPTIQIGKSLLTKELSDEIGIVQTPFEQFGIKNKKDLLEVITDAAVELLSLKEEMPINSSKLATDMGPHYYEDSLFSLAAALNKDFVLANRLKKAEYTLKQLFSNRDPKLSLSIVLKAESRESTMYKKWQYNRIYVTIAGDEITVKGAF